ncbi:MAG: hypothetical protein HWE14_00065 [Flavobacteriia bacterium]|nr:hypothetical protein [Flavobacteriia bacterium]
MKQQHLFTVLALVVSATLFAQPGNPTTPAPFGALEGLIAAGLAYGGYKRFKKVK